MPRDLIERNIKKAQEGKSGDYFELTYEVYGAGGVSIVCQVLTDNANRAKSETRSAVTKAGGKMAESGSVMFNFNRRGVCIIDGGDEGGGVRGGDGSWRRDIGPRRDGASGTSCANSTISPPFKTR